MVWELVESCVVYGDRGYRGCEGVIVCDSREMRAKRQVVEGVHTVKAVYELSESLNIHAPISLAVY